MFDEYFTHNFKAYIWDNDTPQCQWNNPEEYVIL